MKCDNMEIGCQWEGTVGTLEKHVGVCQFTLVPCPKKCKDDNGILMITRRDLQQHLMEECPNRDYSCEHCDLKGTYTTTLDHYDKCEKRISEKNDSLSPPPPPTTQLPEGEIDFIFHL